MKPIPITGKNGVFRGRQGDPNNAPRCLAKTRRGTPCQRAAEWNPHTGRRSRCRLHGGLSTGPKTPEGRARVAAAQIRHGLYSKEFYEAKQAARAKLAELKSMTKGATK